MKDNYHNNKREKRPRRNAKTIYEGQKPVFYILNPDPKKEANNG